MLHLDLNQIDQAALEALERNQIPEGLRLEFKRELDLAGRDARRETAKDVSALANTAGGRIVYGIEERELPDGSNVAGPIRPLTDGTLQATLSDILVSTIHPRPRFASRMVPVQGGFVLVVEVYDSVGRDLHMVTAYGESRFYKRHPQGTFPMTEPEIREAYVRIAASRVNLEASLQAQIQAELDLRKTSLESLIVVPWYSTPHLMHPRQLAEFRSWLRDGPIWALGQHFEPYFQVFSGGFRAVIAASAAPAQSRLYLAAMKTGLVHLSLQTPVGAEDHRFGVLELLDRLVSIVEIAGELLDRAAYWGPVRILHVLRLPAVFTLVPWATGLIASEFGEMPIGLSVHTVYDTNLKEVGQAPGFLAKDLLDQVFHTAGRPECPWFGPRGEVTPQLEEFLRQQPQSPAARVLLGP